MVTTNEANKKLDEAINHVKAAQVLLLELLNPDKFAENVYYGHFVDSIEEALQGLRVINRKLLK